MPDSACLVVDDDPIAASYLMELLRSRDLAVDRASCLKDTETRLTAARYSRLIVDRRLPDGDGLAWLQQRVFPSSLRVLLTSGDQIAHADLPVGVAFIRKPIAHDVLLRWLQAEPSVATDNERGIANAIRNEPLLCDAQALASLGGRMESLQSLRQMFLNELIGAGSWPAHLNEEGSLAQSLQQLHRMNAACALTGCLRLGRIGAELEARLRAGERPEELNLDDFHGVWSDTLLLLQTV